MHRHLPLSAVRAGDRGELPQQQHATAVRLISEAVQRASTILSEAVCAQAGGKVLASVRLLGTWLRDDVAWCCRGRDEGGGGVCAVARRRAAARDDDYYYSYLYSSYYYDYLPFTSTYYFYYYLYYSYYYYS